jgi:hypothetical protein
MPEGYLEARAFQVPGEPSEFIPTYLFMLIFPFLAPVLQQFNSGTIILGYTDQKIESQVLFV